MCGATEDRVRGVHTSQGGAVEIVVAKQVAASRGAEQGGVSACGRERYRIRAVPLYTGTGDDGETGLADGTRVSKGDLRVTAYGDVDELNAILGSVLATGVDDETHEMLDTIQRDLFAIGTHLADPEAKVAPRVAKATIDEASIHTLEGWIDSLDGALPPLRRFLLPGGGSSGATLHVARAVCRRAERSVVTLGADAVPSVILRYINRLSDLLFVMARTVNHNQGVQETEW